MDMLYKIFPQPMKVEEDIIDLDASVTIDFMTKWDNEVRRKILKHMIFGDMKLIDDTMKDYALSLQQQASNFRNKLTLKEKVLTHIKMFNSFFKDIEGSILENHNYFDSMEDILTFYCNLELNIIKHLPKRKDKIQEYNNHVKFVTQKICRVLYVNLAYNMKYIIHVLLKLSYKHKHENCQTVMKIIFYHFLMDAPLETYSDEAFCRYYLANQRWKQLMKVDIDEKKIDAVFFRFNKTEDFIKTNELMKKILTIKNGSLLEIADQLMDCVSTSVKAYFDHMKSKKCSEVPNISSVINIDCGKDEEGDKEFMSLYNAVINTFSDSTITEEPKKQDTFEEIDNICINSDSESDVVEVCENVFILDSDSDIDEILYYDNPAIRKQNKKKPTSRIPEMCIDLSCDDPSEALPQGSLPQKTAQSATAPTLDLTSDQCAPTNTYSKDKDSDKSKCNERTLYKKTSNCTEQLNSKPIEIVTNVEQSYKKCNYFYGMVTPPSDQDFATHTDETITEHTSHSRTENECTFSEVECCDDRDSINDINGKETEENSFEKPSEPYKDNAVDKQDKSSMKSITETVYADTGQSSSVQKDCLNFETNTSHNCNKSKLGNSSSSSPSADVLDFLDETFKSPITQALAVEFTSRNCNSLPTSLEPDISDLNNITSVTQSNNTKKSTADGFERKGTGDMDTLMDTSLCNNSRYRDKTLSMEVDKQSFENKLDSKLDGNLMTPEFNTKSDACHTSNEFNVNEVTTNSVLSENINSDDEFLENMLCDISTICSNEPISTVATVEEDNAEKSCQPNHLLDFNTAELTSKSNFTSTEEISEESRKGSDVNNKKNIADQCEEDYTVTLSGTVIASENVNCNNINMETNTKRAEILDTTTNKQQSDIFTNTHPLITTPERSLNKEIVTEQVSGTNNSQASETLTGEEKSNDKVKILTRHEIDNNQNISASDMLKESEKVAPAVDICHQKNDIARTVDNKTEGTAKENKKVNKQNGVSKTVLFTSSNSIINVPLQDFGRFEKEMEDQLSTKPVMEPLILDQMDLFKLAKSQSSHIPPKSSESTRSDSPSESPPYEIIKPTEFRKYMQEKQNENSKSELKPAGILRKRTRQSKKQHGEDSVRKKRVITFTDKLECYFMSDHSDIDDYDYTGNVVVLNKNGEKESRSATNVKRNPPQASARCKVDSCSVSDNVLASETKQVKRLKHNTSESCILNKVHYSKDNNSTVQHFDDPLTTRLADSGSGTSFSTIERRNATNGRRNIVNGISHEKLKVPRGREKNQGNNIHTPAKKRGRRRKDVTEIDLCRELEKIANSFNRYKT